jgi:IS605 OrfB family transposase
MTLTVQIKLLPTEQQAVSLRKTMETVNAACNRLSELAWSRKEFRQFPMHRLFYRQIRREFPLSAQVVIRLNAKVADAYKLDQAIQREFRKHGSVSYDCRILDFQLAASTVSIWTVDGRIKGLPFTCGERQRNLLQFPKGESDLIFRHCQWFLNVSVDVPETGEKEALGWLGIDLGLVNIAADSDGRVYGDAAKVSGIRARRWRQRKRLQRKGTRSAKRVLRRLSGREHRFARHVNHEISKQICTTAKGTGRGIALENLKGIRSRVSARKGQRRILHSWAFDDLQQKIAYKCRLAGIPLKKVDPRNTSRTCPACGHVAKANRKTRDLFDCVACGFTGAADHIAARNISRRPAIDRAHERDGARAHVQFSLLRK